MKKELIVQLHSRFEQLVHREEESGVEFWLARDLQQVLGYDRWENFAKVIKKAITACEKTGYDPWGHFLEATKMVPLGSGAERPVSDYMLTRYACYLIAQNGDPAKAPIAFASGEASCPSNCRRRRTSRRWNAACNPNRRNCPSRCDRWNRMHRTPVSRQS
ncbi:MAG: hypothetical protein GX621_18005 [Pirellulaceae bacterium]|nr:hypothetical protein [Pirellulaceae bacterium]